MLTRPEPHPVFARARARLEEHHLELDVAALNAITPEELVEGDALTRRSLARRRGTLGAMLVETVEQIGARGVRQELGL